ncbi:methyltransferase [Shewanella sp. NFH-SH190041]|nr:methyltransferase [Shewanella sp. NFH-SH190041]
MFADARIHLPPKVQAKRYQQPDRQKQKQVSQFIAPLLTQLAGMSSKPLVGLNFGRVLEPDSLAMLAQAQHHISQYDPFQAPDFSVLRQQYDFICCYRVFEHFRNPQREWGLLCRLLQHHGYLAICTRLLDRPAQFAKWHHKNNLAHVSFYRRETFEYLADAHGFTLLFAAEDLILLQKTAKSDITPTLNLSPVE